MATAKAKITKKSSPKKISKPAASKPAAKSVVGTSTISAHPVKDFFSRKHDSSENILTIFKNPRIIGAILGEVIGTMILTMILLTLGLYNPLYLIFGILAITVGVFALSGAHLNPAITVGMMASRRVSAIRGTLYIIAQILGAWFGLLIVNAFHLTGGESAAALPQITAVDGSMFWAITMVEFIGAIIIGFFFARALIYKRSAFTFGAVVAGGVFIAILIAIVVTSNYLMLQDAFVLNPAVAIMYQILPSEAANFGTLLGEIGKALTTYAIFPMIGATVGFYLSDLASTLSGEKVSA
ncbi:MAG: aquaporin [Candidatus Nomurabacteria bacterium]|jgi:glycerol uptake facilitator-like aquaporin|nr:aquaporin [Candidatus Nomurabacteria bacterium]